MNVPRLRILLAFARTGSMRAAAEHLGITTSTVSQQIAALDHNPKLNEAVNRAFAAQDPTTDWQDANSIATQDLAWFPLIERVKTVPTSRRVTNWTWQSLGNNADITNIAVNG